MASPHEKSLDLRFALSPSGGLAYNKPIMSGIYTMLLVIYTAGVVVWGGLIFFLNGLRPRLLWLLLIALPFSAAVNLLIERPMVVGLAKLTGQSLNISINTSWWWLFILLLIAPVFEEPIKVLPLALPWVRRLVSTPRAAIWVGLALGVSFSLGEAAYIVYGITLRSQYYGLPATSFVGFALERWISCLLHGVMTAVFVLGIQKRGWRILTGYLTAVFLHTVLNSSTLFVQIGVLSGAIAYLALAFDFILAILLLLWLWNWSPNRQSDITLPKGPQSAS